MEKKVMNTRLAVAAVVLLFGLLLAGQEAAAVGYDDLAGPATETATDAAAGGYAPATEKAAGPTTEAAAPAADAAEATPSGGKLSSVKLTAAAADPTRPGAVANPYTRGCSKIHGCRG